MNKKSSVVKAFAKLNLNLKVLGKRSDGYHDIKSLMVTLVLADDIYISVRASGGIKLSSTDASLPKGKGNLAYRASKEFFSAAGIKPGSVNLHIVKRIPVSAGLAGGSADAAATLKGLNRIYGSPLSKSHLMDAAARIGSDVPFCLHGKPSIVTGRGETLKSAGSIPRLWVVIVCPFLKVSTEWAYKQYDLTKNQTGWYNSRQREFGVIFENDLERATVLKYPQILGLKEILTMLGSQVSLMSGSGPSVFGIFDTQQNAGRAHKALQALGAVKVILTRIR